MSFISEKLKIMIKKNVMRISPSIRLKATDGRTGCRYVRTLDHASEYHAWSVCSVVAATPGVTGALAAGAGDVAQPAAMNSAFVSSKGAATNSNTLKINA